ncbi:MAG: ATP-binding cassette domain-containing protein [Candidatus Nanopelagicaceae bacterium]|nr:ATP-binding cassette domain-containing protein [Candidatus Nanopelagicaceae bacterium]
MSLNIEKVEKQYKILATGTLINALNGISVSLENGQTLGIVGESGCGKSTLARVISGLEKPTIGKITWEGGEIADKAKNHWRPLRSRVQLVFQDPYSSLDPRQQIGAAISEVLTVHKLVPKDEVEPRVDELLSIVGLTSDLKNRYPHQLSGGQRQRVSIARALASEPDLLILDEPVSALDVSVRAEVMNLLIDLRAKYGLTYIFISHDLAMVRYVSDVIAVMYLGKIVEFGSWDQIIERPLHPYTRALIAAMPDHSIIGNPETLSKTLQGEVPDPAHLPAGCAFHARCPISVPECSTRVPLLLEISPKHYVACPEVSE